MSDIQVFTMTLLCVCGAVNIVFYALTASPTLNVPSTEEFISLHEPRKLLESGKSKLKLL